MESSNAGGGGVTIITTPEGKIGTVRAYVYSKGLFRFALNMTLARRRGTHNVAKPQLEPCCEVTVAESEIEKTASWLAASIVAGYLLPSPISLRQQNSSYGWSSKADKLARAKEKI